MTTNAPIKTSEIPATLNGYPVIAWTISANRERALVIVERDAAMHPIVTATWWPELGNAWQWGNYHADLTEGEDYRRQWVKTHGIYADEGTPRIKIEGRIGGFQ